jgi:hypothetical protein
MDRPHSPRVVVSTGAIEVTARALKGQPLAQAEASQANENDSLFAQISMPLPRLLSSAWQQPTLGRRRRHAH